MQVCVRFYFFKAVKIFGVLNEKIVSLFSPRGVIK